MKIATKQELEELNAIVSELAALKYFPSEPGGVLAIVKDVANMVNSLDDARWLVRRMRVLYNEWPGPRELRAVFCYDHLPADGIKAISEVYANGFPEDHAADPARQLWAGPPGKPEPWPEEELAEARRILDEASARARREHKPLWTPAVDQDAFLALMAKIEPTYQPITEADIEAELQRKRGGQ